MFPHNYIYIAYAKAKSRFVDCEKWRKEFGPKGLDDLVRNFEYTEKAEVFQYYPQYYHKTDKVLLSSHSSLLPTAHLTREQDGRPVYIEQLGNIDLAAMYKITTAERMLQNLAVEYEKLADPRLPACSRKSGQLLETCCTVMDLKGVGVTKVPSVYSYVKQASAMSQNYYPERLGRLYLINAPWGFSTVFGVVKGWLDPITVEKIHVLGGGYQKELLAQIPAENLPTTFGGSCKCDGGCALSDVGPWTEPEWAKPAKWQQPAPAPAAEGQTVIDNANTNPGTIPDAGKPAAAPAPAPAPASAVETEDEIKAAPARQ